MAESADILKEYLISVGVKADDGALSKLTSILSSIQKTVTTLTGALAAGITAIEGLVSVTTSELDDLYWATKRLKSSAGDIQDFELRMRKAGRTAHEAREALETIAAFRRTNPAGDAFLGVIGVNSEGRGDVDVMDALIKRFKQLNQQGQYWLAVRFGERLGLDERMVWSMVRTSVKAEHVYNDMYKRLGINQAKAVKDAHEYQNQLKELGAEFDVVAQTIGLKFLPVAREALEWLMKSPDAKAIGNALLGVSSSMADIATGASKLIGMLPPEAREFGLIGWFLFGKKMGIILAGLGAVSSFLDKTSGDVGNVREDKVNEAGESKRGDRKLARWFYDHGLGYLNSNDFNATYEAYLTKNPNKRPTSNDKPVEKDESVPIIPQGVGQTLGTRSNNPGNLMPGGKEAVYKTPEEGMLAMGKLLVRYAKRGLVTVNDIVHTYAPPNANNTEAYVKRVSREMDVAPTQKLQLSDPSVLRKLMTAMIRVEQGYMPYSSNMVANASEVAIKGGTMPPSIPSPPSQPEANTKPSNASPTPPANATTKSASALPHMPSNAKTKPSSTAPALTVKMPSTPRSQPLGAGGKGTNVVINQENHTTIHGAKDPDTTAKKFEKVGVRNNGDLVRNMSTAVL